MKHTTLFEPQLSWPDMDLRTAYGNMFVTNAYVKPFALLTKPKESLTTWWSLCKPNTKQVRGNLERCSPGQVPSSALATPCSFRWPSGIHSDLDLPLCTVPILGGLQQVKLPLAFNIDKTHVKKINGAPQPVTSGSKWKCIQSVLICWRFLRVPSCQHVTIATLRPDQ